MAVNMQLPGLRFCGSCRHLVRSLYIPLPADQLMTAQTARACLSIQRIGVLCIYSPYSAPYSGLSVLQNIRSCTWVQSSRPGCGCIQTAAATYRQLRPMCTAVAAYCSRGVGSTLPSRARQRKCQSVVVQAARAHKGGGRVVHPDPLGTQIRTKCKVKEAVCCHATNCV